MAETTPRNQTALVTGASAGIGLEIAHVFAEEGFDLVLVARRAEALEKLSRRLERGFGARVVVLAMDLLREGAGADLEHALEREALAIDILVNNVGVIEDVASLAAFQPVPTLALYAATKSFVLSLTESLSEELKGTGVSVTALCPGLTRTDMVEHAKQASLLARQTPGFLISDPRAVAREGVDACLSGRVIAVPGHLNWVTANLVRLYPRWLVRGVSGLVGRRGLRRGDR
jgi:short-subunit dehydrogenase